MEGREASVDKKFSKEERLRVLEVSMPSHEFVTLNLISAWIFSTCHSLVHYVRIVGKMNTLRNLERVNCDILDYLLCVVR